MIAVRPLNGKIGKTSWTVLEGRSIPEHILETLDVDALKKSGDIKEEKKVIKKETAEK